MIMFLLGITYNKESYKKREKERVYKTQREFKFKEECLE